MDEEDFELAFQLYGHVKSKLVEPSFGFPSRFYQTSAPPTSHAKTSSVNIGIVNTASSDHNISTTSNTSPTFRSNFVSSIPPKPSSIAPLHINQSSKYSANNSNRQFILPNKSPHAKYQKNSVIQVNSTSTATLSPKSAGFVSAFPESAQMETWDDEDDVLAPVPGISPELTIHPSPKRVSSRAPSRVKLNASTSPHLAKRSGHSENNHTVSMGADEEVSVLPADASARAVPPECDREAAQHWKYPSNYEKREYQFAMVESALFQNSLICLPTGLGKTLIAAVVMYNFYRWFPSGKIIFMAPTKPLVAQQISACRDIVSIPPSESIVMTGKMASDTRARHWHSKRIFFVTPQIPQNDIASGICPADQVCLLVFDEAHKAHGDYAYCDVIRAVAKATPYFRVLALSATPGSDFSSIQDVLTNLLISKIELRTEDSPDVKPFVHTRFVEEIAVKLDGPIMKAKELLKILINVPITWLQAQKALYRTKSGDNFTFTRLEAARSDFRTNPVHQRREEYWRANVEARFAAAMAMYHGFKLISDYGLGAFKEWLNAQTAKPVFEKTSQFFSDMVHSKEWSALYRFVNEEIGDASKVRHPKMTKLEGVVLDHFSSFDSGLSGIEGIRVQGSSSETRVMIFVQFRDSVEDIVAMLKQHEPMIRPMAFVGQSKKGLSQKQQAEVVARFREGHYNTLVSTSIGEEGLDIGEVDLIVCYDAQQSPIRMIQRMGRTGRKRNGRCIMLLTSGTEDVSYKRSQVKSKQMIRTISSSTRFAFYKGAESKHILPSDLPIPRPLMCHMEPIIEPETEPQAPKRRAKRSSAKRAASIAPSEPEPSITHETSLIEHHHTHDDTNNDSDAEESPFEFEASEFEDDDSVASEMEMQLEENTDIIQNASETSDTQPHTKEKVALESESSILPSRAALLPPTSSTPIPSVTSPLRSPGIPDIQVKNEKTRPQAQNLFTAPVEPVNSVLARSSSRSSILDQSKDSLELMGPQLKPLDDFPIGFFDSASNASQCASIYIPPPPEISLPVEFELGLLPRPSTGIQLQKDENVPLLPIALQVPTVLPPTSSQMSTSAAVAPISVHSTSQPSLNKMTFHHSSPSVSISKPMNITTNATVQSAFTEKPPSDALTPKKTEISSEKFVPPLASNNTSIRLSQSLESSAPNSPNFKRLKRGRQSEDDLILMGDSESELSSPPTPKRSCTLRSNRPKKSKPKKSRYIDEEASLDDENSDGLDISADERFGGLDSIPNSQDIAFIASDGECDTSLTGMKAVYAKSLSSPSGKQKNRRPLARGLQGLDWLHGENLERKMKEWAEYSDMEETSLSQSSASALGGSLPSSVQADMNISLYSIDSEPIEEIESFQPAKRTETLPNPQITSNATSSVSSRVPTTTSSSSFYQKPNHMEIDSDDDDILNDAFLPVQTSSSLAKPTASINRHTLIKPSQTHKPVTSSQASLKLGFQKHAFSTSTGAVSASNPKPIPNITQQQPKITQGAIGQTSQRGLGFSSHQPFNGTKVSTVPNTMPPLVASTAVQNSVTPINQGTGYNSVRSRVNMEELLDGLDYDEVLEVGQPY